MDKTKINKATLIRSAGLFAILAGILYIVIQFIHPAEELSAVNTDVWVIVSCLSMVMAIFFLIGILGIYVRQVEEAGWLGLIGFIVFSLFWLVTMAYSFIETFVLPLISSEMPLFVEGMLGLFGESESEAALGIFPILVQVVGLFYLLGALLLGIATFRANVFPRVAGILLALSAVITLLTAVIPHPMDRMLAIPMGVAFIWLGYTLWKT